MNRTSYLAGYGYAYADANSPSLRWTGKQLNTNLKGALGSTLDAIYSASSSDVAWLMYNGMINSCEAQILIKVI